MSKPITVVYVIGQSDTPVFTDSTTEVVPQLGTHILIGIYRYRVDRIVYNPTRYLYSESIVMRVDVYVSRVNAGNTL